MKVGVWIPAYRRWVKRDAVLTLATEAEALGFGALWVQDHLVAPTGDEAQARVDPIGGWLKTEEYSATVHSAVDYYGKENWWLDPYMTWGFLAACTHHVELASCIIVLPYRDPIVQAKMLGTLDVLSGGRTLFGVGSGHVEAEFDALGVPFAERGPRTDEYIRIIRALLAGEEVAFAGDYISFPTVRPLIRSDQRPAPPVYVGGNSKRSIRRAVEEGDGWLPVHLDPDELRTGMQALAERAAKAERETPATGITLNWAVRDPENEYTGPSQRKHHTIDEAAKLIEAYAALDVVHLAIDLPNPSLDVLRRQYELLAQAAEKAGVLAPA
jgi:probable F420-dependent oxidoreductase